MEELMKKYSMMGVLSTQPRAIVHGLRYVRSTLCRRLSGKGEGLFRHTRCECIRIVPVVVPIVPR